MKVAKSAGERRWRICCLISAMPYAMAAWEGKIGSVLSLGVKGWTGFIVAGIWKLEYGRRKDADIKDRMYVKGGQSSSF